MSNSSIIAGVLGFRLPRKKKISLGPEGLTGEVPTVPYSEIQAVMEIPAERFPNEAPWFVSNDPHFLERAWIPIAP